MVNPFKMAALLALGAAGASMPSDTGAPGSKGLVANGKLPLAKTRGHWQLSGNVESGGDESFKYVHNTTHLISNGDLWALDNGTFFGVPHPPEPQSPSPAKPVVPAPAATPAQPLSQPKTQSQTLPWWSWTEKDSKIFGGIVGGFILLSPLLFIYRHSINRSIDRCLSSRSRNDIENSIVSEVPESLQVRYPPNTHNFIANDVNLARGANEQNSPDNAERAVLYREEGSQQTSKLGAPPLNSDPLPSAPLYLYRPSQLQFNHQPVRNLYPPPSHAHVRPPLQPHMEFRLTWVRMNWV